MESLIKEIVSKNDFDKDWAKITGQPERIPSFFKHVHTEEEYSFIAGAVGWPVYQEKPGCVIIIGVSKDDTPSYEILDAAFHDSPKGVMELCLELRTKWGHKESRSLFQNFIGLDRFDTLQWEINQGLHRKLFFLPPSYMDRPDSDEIYIQHLNNLSEMGKLKISVQEVQDQLSSLTTEDFDKKLVKYPVLTAVTYGLYTIDEMTPWIVQSTFNFDDEESPDAINLDD